MDEKRITKLRTRFAPGILNALITVAGNDARLAYVEKSTLDKAQHATKKADECKKPVEVLHFADPGPNDQVPCNLPAGHEGDCTLEMRGGLLMPEPIDPSTLVTVSAYDVDKLTDLALEYADVLARKALTFDADRAEHKKQDEIAAAVSAARALDAAGTGRVQIEEVNGSRAPVASMPERPNPGSTLS